MALKVTSQLTAMSSYMYITSTLTSRAHRIAPIAIIICNCSLLEQLCDDGSSTMKMAPVLLLAVVTVPQI
jgi:hypothetical protein